MAWITPKTFTANDYYNADDLNRVENNTDYICDYIETFANRPPVGTIKTDWSNTDIPFYDDLNKVEGNILAIKTAIGQPLNWIVPITNWVSLNIFDYEDANRLENNLVELKQVAENVFNGLLYCGTFNAGQQTML